MTKVPVEMWIRYSDGSLEHSLYTLHGKSKWTLLREYISSRLTEWSIRRDVKYSADYSGPLFDSLLERHTIKEKNS